MKRAAPLAAFVLGVVAHVGSTAFSAADAEPGGWDDYSGEFDPGFQLEDLSHRALVTVCQEIPVQIHLLVRAFMLCAAQRQSEEVASELGRAQWTGIAALTAERLRALLAIDGDGLGEIAKLFQIHPCFQPRAYVAFGVALGPDAVRISIGDCDALSEGDGYSWFAGLGVDEHPALQAIARSVNPRARCHPVADPPQGAVLAWDIAIDENADPAPEPQELSLARISRGAAFQFERRRGLRS